MIRCKSSFRLESNTEGFGKRNSTVQSPISHVGFTKEHGPEGVDSTLLSTCVRIVGSLED